MTHKYHAGTGITYRDGQIVEADAATGLRGGAGPENVESVEVESQPADVTLALVDRPRVGARVGGSRGIAGVLKRGNMRVSTKKRPFVTGPSPILTKIAPEVGIDPKPGHEVLF